MKSSVVLLLLIVVTSCKDRIDKGSVLTLTTKNETSHSVLISFFPAKGSIRLIDDLVLLPLSQQDRTFNLEVPNVPIGDDFPFVAYGKVDSVRIEFNNSRVLSFRRPTNGSECSTPFNIFCANSQVCKKESDSKGQCVYTVTEQMFASAKPK